MLVGLQGSRFAVTMRLMPGGADKYTKLNELVKNTHKDNPKPEDLAELRGCFDEILSCGGHPATWPGALWTTYYALTIHNLLTCESA